MVNASSPSDADTDDEIVITKILAWGIPSIPRVRRKNEVIEISDDEGEKEQHALKRSRKEDAVSNKRQKSSVNVLKDHRAGTSRPNSPSVKSGPPLTYQTQVESPRPQSVASGSKTRPFIIDEGPDDPRDQSSEKKPAVFTKREEVKHPISKFCKGVNNLSNHKPGPQLPIGAETRNQLLGKYCKQGQWYRSLDSAFASSNLWPSCASIQSGFRYASLSGSVQRHRYKAPGAINAIAQSGRYCAIASATVDGDNPDPTSVDPYNLPGALVAYKNGEGLLPCKGHMHAVPGAAQPKYYALTDVQFDPLQPNIFASSGYDSTVRFWACNNFLDEQLEDGKSIETLAYQEVQFSSIPVKLGYKPQSSLLAIGGSNGELYFEEDTTNFTVSITSDAELHQISDFAWGTGPSSELVIAATCTSLPEDIPEPDTRGFHKIVDVGSERIVATLNAKDAGHAVTVSHAGGYSYLYTKGPLSGHTLWVHDLKQKNSKACASISLDAPITAEVNTITLSPDDILVALTWTHNKIHVYDSRFLKNGPLHTYTHGPSLAAKETFGVVQAYWTTTPSETLDLISGGADGCIRIWDVKRACDDPKNGEILLKALDDIGFFCLGDIYKDETPFVVGTCQGDVLSLE